MSLCRSDNQLEGIEDFRERLEFNSSLTAVLGPYQNGAHNVHYGQTSGAHVGDNNDGLALAEVAVGLNAKQEEVSEQADIVPAQATVMPQAANVEPGQLSAGSTTDGGDWY